MWVTHSVLSLSLAASELQASFFRVILHISFAFRIAYCPTQGLSSISVHTNRERTQDLSVKSHPDSYVKSIFDECITLGREALLEVISVFHYRALTPSSQMPVKLENQS